METNNSGFTPNFGGNFEGKQKIDVTAVYVLAVIGILLSWCCSPIGIILAVIAVILVSNKLSAYKSNPSGYFGVENLNTAKIIAYVALGLNILFLIWTVYRLATTDWNVIMQQYQDILQQAEQMD
ncbi:CCC motif membrane protein [Capnocytophaga sp.]|uniref:CCC motif membrane protein n=1 Tax=Capnocytophaga sp. TaxID=44737 RepID=UPI0026DC1999|nr:CCC motif membrane protein [Capnocytophaga sp.]MDO5105114.1 CCC motif membrane protein [Capnocytophaga sp.]